MPAPDEIAKEFPKKGDLQLFRLEKLHEFQCVHCQKTKRSKMIAIQGGTGRSYCATAATVWHNQGMGEISRNDERTNAIHDTQCPPAQARHKLQQDLDDYLAGDDMGPIVFRLGTNAFRNQR